MYCGKEEVMPQQHVHHSNTSRRCDYYLCSNCDPRVGKGAGATDVDYGLRVRTYTITRYVIHSILNEFKSVLEWVCLQVCCAVIRAIFSTNTVAPLSATTHKPINSPYYDNTRGREHEFEAEVRLHNILID